MVIFHYTPAVAFFYESIGHTVTKVTLLINDNKFAQVFEQISMIMC